MVGLSDLTVDGLDESTLTASFSIKMIPDIFTHYLAGGGVGRRFDYSLAKGPWEAMDAVQNYTMALRLVR